MLRTVCPIETDRLVLRPFRPGDLEDVYAYQSRPDVARYLYWDVRDRAQVQEALDRTCRETTFTEEGDWLSFAVVWGETGVVVGEVGLRLLSRGHRQGETGFIFNPDYQGRGLAAEAAEAMLRLGFEDAGLHRIIGRCDARNGASARLMEKLGMRREAHFVQNEVVKEEWRDELVYGLLKREWKARGMADRRTADRGVTS
ncbi:GNAT family protein [Streptomyces sp. B-S-A8]|uniref:GNAT family protein n=1 Tax=Streptomyces solicavernae TaxID=3043614 RepID=A0ABT6S055_9ACTN|nr:GNAT family protein [Streptomyces sp. B-S-A8]MDI3390079.1 GNAT family protein [Streptomyces sp. B-S-A8]